MPAEPFLLVVGTGTAGNACGRTLARSGLSVTAVERDRVGGLCLWAGCMPKKALYNAASSVRSLSRMEQWGISCPEVSVDWSGVLAWKWHAQETYAGDQEALARDAGIELVKGEARFIAPGVVAVDGDEYRPENVLIASGSESVRLDIPGAALADTSAQALSYHECPASLAIIGGGFIAMEFAGIFAAFGTRVTVVMRGERPLRVYDGELADIARRSLEELGVEFVPKASVRGISGWPGDLTLSWDDEHGETQRVSAERVLMAVGRRPALDDLDLATAELELDEHGLLVVHDGIRTSDPSVWIAGDAAGGLQFTPVARAQGSAVASALLGQPVESLDYAAIPTAVFTVPELAMVGLSEETATASGLEYQVKIGTFEYVGEAIVADERHGLVKILVDADDRIIGAGIAGPRASDLIYACAVAMKMGARSADFAAAAAAHPSFSEGVNWAAW